MLVLHEGRTLIRLDPATGSKRWSCPLGLEDLSNRPGAMAFDDRRFYCISRFTTDGDPACRLAGDGTAAWTSTWSRRRRYRGGSRWPPSMCSPIRSGSQARVVEVESIPADHPPEGHGDPRPAAGLPRRRRPRREPAARGAGGAHPGSRGRSPSISTTWVPWWRRRAASGASGPGSRAVPRRPESAGRRGDRPAPPGIERSGMRPDGGPRPGPPSILSESRSHPTSTTTARIRRTPRERPDTRSKSSPATMTWRPSNASRTPSRASSRRWPR